MKTIIYYFPRHRQFACCCQEDRRTTGRLRAGKDFIAADDTGRHRPSGRTGRYHLPGILSPVCRQSWPNVPGISTFRVRSHILRSYLWRLRGVVGTRHFDSILRMRNRGLDAGFMVKMPGNYILMYSSPVGRKRENVLAKADTQIEDIAERSVVARKGNYRLPFLQTWYIHSHIPGLLPVCVKMTGNLRSVRSARHAGYVRRSARLKTLNL